MSFSDMMSSGRGPGVIGMVLALIVLLGFGLLFMFASDETERVGKSIESVIAHQGREIIGYDASITHGRKNLDLGPARVAMARQLSSVKLESQTLEANIANLKKNIESAKGDIVRTQEELETYKDEYRAYARGKAKGETMEKLETTTGEVYKDVNIREVTAIGIQIRHADGQKRIPFEELPESMKDHFQFDPEQKDEAVAAESAIRSVHEAAAAVADDLASQKMSAQRAKAEEEAKDKIRQDIALTQGQIAQLKEEIKGLVIQMDRAAAEANAARAAGRMHINKSGSISSNIRSKQVRINSLHAELNQLKARL